MQNKPRKEIELNIYKSIRNHEDKTSWFLFFSSKIGYSAYIIQKAKRGV